MKVFGGGIILPSIGNGVSSLGLEPAGHFADSPGYLNGICEALLLQLF